MTTEDKPLRLKDTHVTGDYFDVQTETTWQGKTNGYLRTEKVVLKILDRHEHEVTGIWDGDWSTCGPGIETRRGSAGSVSHLLGRTKHETRVDHDVRIHQLACPVSILFRATNEYVDYNDAQYSSRDQSVYWVRYVV